MELWIDPANAGVDFTRPETCVLQGRPPAVQHRGRQIIDKTAAETDHAALLVDIEIVPEDQIGIAC